MKKFVHQTSVVLAQKMACCGIEQCQQQTLAIDTEESLQMSEVLDTGR